MNEQFPDDPRQKENLQAFYGTLAERDLDPAQTSFVQLLPTTLPEDFRVAGTKSCLDCHESDFETWHASTHASAWESLTHTGAHVDSQCQQCHTTGFGFPSGFLSARRSLQHRSVGCESCHGPSQAHQQDPQVRTAYTGQARNQCVDCHDRENSPQFAFDEYWAKIRHGFDETGSSEEHVRPVEADGDHGR